MRKLGIVTVIMSALFVFSSCQQEDFNFSNEIDATIDGFVFDNETGNPIEGAKVTISDKANNTSAEGYFNVSGLATGDYCAKIEKEGYASMLSCGSIAIDGKDYYGNKIQTSIMGELYPADKELELQFRYQKLNEDTQEMEWFDAPSDITVYVSYGESYLIDVFEPFTTNSSGRIIVDNIAYTDIHIEISKILGSDRYTLTKEISGDDLKVNDGELRIEIERTEIEAASEIDINY
ncbi:MAG: carboxypeptidase-like regulatory domain-containing protein [Bacteroidales bacterium]